MAENDAWKWGLWFKVTLAVLGLVTAVLPALLTYMTLRTEIQQNKQSAASKVEVDTGYDITVKKVGMLWQDSDMQQRQMDLQKKQLASVGDEVEELRGACGRKCSIVNGHVRSVSVTMPAVAYASPPMFSTTSTGVKVSIPPPFDKNTARTMPATLNEAVQQRFMVKEPVTLPAAVKR